MQTDPATVKISELSNRLVPKFYKIEGLLALAVVLLKLVEIYTDSSLAILNTALLMLLAIGYYFSAFMNSEAEMSAIQKFIAKMIGFGSSMTVIGILFRMQNWPGYDIALSGGGVILAACLLVFLFQKSSASAESMIPGRVLLRVAILCLICALFLFLPEDTLLRTGLIKVVELPAL